MEELYQLPHRHLDRLDVVKQSSSSDFFSFYSFLLVLQKHKNIIEGPIGVLSSLLGESITSVFKHGPVALTYTVEELSQPPKVGIFCIGRPDSIYKQGIRLHVRLQVLIYQFLVSLSNFRIPFRELISMRVRWDSDPRHFNP